MSSPRPRPVEPVDPDVDLTDPSQRRQRWRDETPVVAAVALGGGLGAAARYAATLWWPTPPGGFPYATLAVNVAGCALIGVLMVLVTDLWTTHRLVRPFVGTGVLGGFTTFSAYAENIEHLITGGHAAVALAYLALTLLAALAAVWTAALLTRRLVRGRGGSGRSRADQADQAGQAGRSGGTA
ncbi:CrcB family protein [Streptomyces sp. 549]|uniref:fluoride efflux transporter FluC n=1 Tax=Streptomyces sp. 549 TaxID=3049076 RepID=UPI0024C3C171|nr:CrcB family protein [Streptomyces sp. 549]MDK1475460.1 CrcB family protein [Streptomyces sp. 549]